MSKGWKGQSSGMYDELQSNDQYGAKFMTLMEVRGDNVKNDNSGASGGITYQIEVFTETPANSNLSGAWLSLYTAIYRCNLMLQNTDNVRMSDEQRTKIEGQASFVRALCYFNLVRLWGKSPVNFGADLPVDGLLSLAVNTFFHIAINRLIDLHITLVLKVFRKHRV